MRFVRQFLLCLLLAPFAAIGQSLDQQELAIPSQRVFASWVEHSFPALALAKRVPENLYLGYVVNEQFQVLQYSAYIAGYRADVPFGVNCGLVHGRHCGAASSIRAECRRHLGRRPYREPGLGIGGGAVA